MNDVIMALEMALRQAGVSVRTLATASRREAITPDQVVEIDGVRFAIERRGRLPYPNELRRLDDLQARLRQVGVPLMVVPFVPITAEETLRAAGWSWSDDVGNFDLRAPGMLLRQRVSTEPLAATTASKLPQGSGSLAIIRALIGFSDDETEEPGVGSLAAQARVSQPRASQVLNQLHELELVRRMGRGRWKPDRPALLDRFLADYRGPGGTENHWYSLEPLGAVAAQLTALPRHASRAGSGSEALVASADVGPDLIAAWRRPTALVVYVRGYMPDLRTTGLVPAQGRDDANVIVRFPRDTSMFPTPGLAGTLRGVEVQLADPTQMMWDLHHLGGQDRIEAAESLREWLLTH
jgi:hypothetical protein